MFFCLGVASAHTNLDNTRKLQFPDVPGYKTLKCDLHMHTVFSDGNVWPSIRVEEALKDNLDAISITDHLEKLKHGADIPMPDRNRSHEEAAKAAEGTDLIVIQGTEITRSMPPGHANAIFITDTNKVLVDDPIVSQRGEECVIQHLTGFRAFCHGRLFPVLEQTIPGRSKDERSRAKHGRRLFRRQPTHRGPVAATKALSA